MSSFTFQGSTCLVEACRNRDLGMIDLLLKYGARDDECKALMVAAAGGESIIASKLLALKANQGSFLFRAVVACTLCHPNLHRY